MEELWAVVLWEHGWHCDEWDIVRVEGPFTRERALELEDEYSHGEYEVTVAPMKGEKE